MTFQIYKITNKINGMKYIGQTKKSLLSRFTQHCRKDSCCIFLRNAIQKYSRDNFSIELIEKHDCPVTVSYREKVLIKELNTKSPSGYNLRIMGSAPYSIIKGAHKRPQMSNFKGKIHTLEARTLMSKAKKGKRFNRKTEFKSGNIPWSKGLKIDRSAARKEVIDITTGFVWQSVKEAAEIYNLKPANLAGRLRGRTINDTNLRYVEAV